MKFDFSGLVAQGLIIKKPLNNGLFLYKYHNRVFYDNLWHLDPLLREARGIILDVEDNVVVYPFTKLFDLGENGTTVHPDTFVRAVRKVNGFMATATKYKGEVIYGTTGTIGSDFAKLAKSVILEYCPNFEVIAGEGVTFIFEICHHSDPHIVQEDEGAYLIGMRDTSTGVLVTESWLDSTSAVLKGIKRPTHFTESFSGCQNLLNLVDHEGYIIQDAVTDLPLVKLKSPYYLFKKWATRGNSAKVFNEQVLAHVDEEYYPIIKLIREQYTKESWDALTEQEKNGIVSTMIEEM